MKLIKKQLLALPATPLPQNFRRPKDDCDYIYTANEFDKVLAMELYTPAAQPGDLPEYRVFCTTENWINYNMAQRKWGHATLDCIGKPQGEYWRYNRFCAANGRSAAAADSLLQNYKAGKAETAECVRMLQNHIQYTKRRALAEKRQKETDAVFAQWPPLPPGWEKRLENGPWAHSKYCFYQKTPRNALSLVQKMIEKELPGTLPPYYGLCSACGKSFALDKPLKHTPGVPFQVGTYQCPVCGAWLHPKKYGLGRGNLYAAKYLLLATARDGKIYMDLIHADRRYNTPTFKTRATPCCRWLLDTQANTVAMWEGYGLSWRKKEQATEPPIAGYSIDDSVTDAVNATRLRYGAQLINCKDTGVIRAAAALTKYPALEMVDKLGKRSWARDVIWHRDYAKQAINLKGQNMQEVLGLTKEELNRAKIHCGTSFELLIFKALRKEGQWYTKATAETLRGIYKRKKFLKIADLTGMAKALKYVEKQYSSGASEIHSIQDAADFWDDYLSECNILQYDLTDPYNLMPPDLMQAHNCTMRLVSNIQNKALDNLLQQRLPELERQYCFAADGLIIRPAANVWELKQEGEKLHHCVATYASKYADGTTTILVVRHQADPDTPYVTVEYQGGRIVQARAYRNGVPPEEVTEFLKKWTKQLKKKSKTAAQPAA